LRRGGSGEGRRAAAVGPWPSSKKHTSFGSSEPISGNAGLVGGRGAELSSLHLPVFDAGRGFAAGPVRMVLFFVFVGEQARAQPVFVGSQGRRFGLSLTLIRGPGRWGPRGLSCLRRELRRAVEVRGEPRAGVNVFVVIGPPVRPLRCRERGRLNLLKLLSWSWPGVGRASAHRSLERGPACREEENDSPLRALVVEGTPQKQATSAWPGPLSCWSVA